jgi:hypothetical protein
MKSTMKLFLLAVLLTGTALAGDMGSSGRGTPPCENQQGCLAAPANTQTIKVSNQIVMIFISRYIVSILS